MDIDGNSPYYTLAVEEHILNTLPLDSIVLLTYVHAPSVIIGRNQNAWSEFDSAVLNSLGGVPARRISGGGAVYHDLGNLNFSFVVCNEGYNLERQLRMLGEAAAMLGADVYFSGRNDMLCAGKKFSGHAYCIKKHASVHHGTVLIDVDLDAMQRCLNVSGAKISSKGIKSVRARVINLNEVIPGVTVAAFKAALKEAFEVEYGVAKPYVLNQRDYSAITAIRERNSAWSHIYGESPKCDVELNTRFDKGSLQLLFKVEGGVIVDAHVYSDAMEEAFIARLPESIINCRYSAGELCGAILTCADTTEEQTFAREIAAYIRGAIAGNEKLKIEN